MEEDRRYKRWQIEKSAQCCFQRSTLSGSLRDISLKGARISLDAPEMSLGKTCDLSIRILRELEPLNIVCDVVWQRKIDKNTELGLYFTEIKDKDKDRIFDYVFEHFPQQLIKQWWPEVK